ncbi:MULTISPECIES: 2-keto-4-pentenoate hydratase [Gordonia]|uniref:2-keto-4-pentenoate hydratase n=1 Tax=Gordonia sp. 'Campus' TaxID=2915824 RepID=UPI001EE41053|nr:fumarylacetoacetate hydrolase family protein [Gordonia sp. 'Campus']
MEDDVSKILRTSDPSVRRAAEALQSAAARRSPCLPVRALIGVDDPDVAYAVQQRVVAARVDAGARIVGRKIGLTAPVVQKQLGVDQPDFGILLDDMSCAAGAVVALDCLLQPKVEAEIGFVLAEDLAEGDLSYEQVHGAVAYAVAALEIVDSRIAGWDITFADTVADNASSGLFVLGDERRTLGEFEPQSVNMTMSVDGDVVSTGTGADCLGDPLNALRWLAVTARDFGQPLQAGQVVLSGALGPMVPVAGPCHVRADISGLGSVSTTFVKELVR